MATKPNQNHNARDVNICGPKYRKDICNPQIGANGPDVYLDYAVNDNKDVCLSGFTEGGTYRCLADQSIVLAAGAKSPEGGIDIVIASANGDITITAMKNGAIRIKGANIMLQADEDIDLKAGRNINLNASSGRILLKSNKADVEALAGNIVEATTGSFVQRVFDGSFVGQDFLASAGAITGIGDVANVVGNVAGGLLF